MASFYGTTDWKTIRYKVLDRDGNKCIYCGSTERLVVHHIVPRNMGGKDEPFNLITLCRVCHRTEHGFIGQNGLATIPGPEWEIYRFDLTRHGDVMRYANQLDKQGAGGDYLRSLEELRGV